MPQAESRAAIPATLEGVLRQLLREVVREEVPALVRGVLATFRAEAAAPASSRSSPYVTVAEAAAHVGVTEKTVRGWIRSGRIKAVSAGRLLRIGRSELERFVSSAGLETNATDVDALAAQVLAKRKR